MAGITTVQVIDEDKVFHPVNEFLQKTGLFSNGLDYHVVSVFGSQSTGKSTLLNGLFGTNFQVMDGSHRRQTTKGIWMSQAVNTSATNERKSHGNLPLDSDNSSDDYVRISPRNGSPDYAGSGSDGLNILVLDVEGTDGRERGEDQDFERKSALFALATSEVLIVNMWENQVGLYQGANMGLLKTVFEVNLALFGKNKKKSVLLFVIRDYLGISALSDLANTVIIDLQKQWQDISKPEGLETSRFEDYFDVQFFGLPHKILKPEQFFEQVGHLSRWFSDKNDTDNHIFNPIYHRGVPIDGWDMYASSVWEQIEENKDLDLPTQQILVARFRCEEILALAWEAFENGLQDAGLTTTTTAATGGNSVKHNPSFGETITKLRTNALEYFNATASRYHKTVYNEKLSELNNKIDTKLSLLFKTQLHLLSNEILAEFKQFKFDPSIHDSTALKTSKAASLAKYESAARLASIGGTYHYSEEQALFADQLDELEANIREQEVARVVTRCNKRITKTLNDKLSNYFSSPSNKTWDQVLDFFNETIRNTVDPYVKTGFNIGEPNVDRTVLEIRKATWVTLDSKLKDVIREDAVVSKLKDNFETKFKYDSETKVPKVWTPSDDIQTPFVAARDSSLELLPIFAEAKLSSGEKVLPEMPLGDGDDDDDDDEYDDGAFYQRLSSSQQEKITERFKQQADSVYVDTKRATTQTATQIPAFVFVIIAVLGWNEFMTVLRNPFLFVFSLLIIGGFYVVHTLHMWGPVISVTNAMVNETMTVLKAKLREILEVPAAVSAEAHRQNLQGNSLSGEETKGEEIEMDIISKMPGGFN